MLPVSILEICCKFLKEKRLRRDYCIQVILINQTALISPGFGSTSIFEFERRTGSCSKRYYFCVLFLLALLTLLLCLCLCQDLDDVSIRFLLLVMLCSIHLISFVCFFSSSFYSFFWIIFCDRHSYNLVHFCNLPVFSLFLFSLL